MMQVKERIILASRSPRRKELLSENGIFFDIVVREVDEDLSFHLSPASTCISLALQKGIQVAKEYPDRVVLSADTIVCCKDKILGKPQNRKDAFEMLSFLSGNSQTVLTGFSIICLERGIKTVDYAQSEIVFQTLSKERIESYLDTGDYRDKAGSYGIQSGAFDFVERIQGDMDTIVGLPVRKVMQYLNVILR